MGWQGEQRRARNADAWAFLYTETLAYRNCHGSRDKIEESNRRRDGLHQIQTAAKRAQQDLGKLGELTLISQ